MVTNWKKGQKQQNSHIFFRPQSSMFDPGANWLLGKKIRSQLKKNQNQQDIQQAVTTAEVWGKWCKMLHSDNIQRPNLTS